jgi:ABC-type phosphate transport system substrate-binding protein
MDTGIAVIMAPSEAPSKLDREELGLIFKLKKRFGSDGQRIQPVNLSANHSLRRAFSMQIFGHNPEELEDYWRDMYFHGVQPPYVLASEEAVIRFVAATPGAIGYVSQCLVDHRVSVVMRLDTGMACPR